MGMVLITLLAFIAGALAGYFLLRLGILGHARIVELEQALAATEAELADYKQRVTEEFTDTAEKFRALNRSYEDLHRQLAKSANVLCGEAGAPKLLDYSAASALQEQPGDPIDLGNATVDVAAQQAAAPPDSTAMGVTDHSEEVPQKADQDAESAGAVGGVAPPTNTQDSARLGDRPQA